MCRVMRPLRYVRNFVAEEMDGVFFKTDLVKRQFASRDELQLSCNGICHPLTVSDKIKERKPAISRPGRQNRSCVQ